MNNAIEAHVAPRSRHPALLAPNLLTLARIAAVPLIVACLLIGGPAARWTAFALFVVAAITDYVDGYLARRLAQRSALGVMLDPIADKLLVGAAIVMLAGDGTISGGALIPAVIILGREILVSGLREYLAGLEVAVPVSRLAKIKTTTQLVAIAILFAGAPGEALLPGLLLAGTVLLWIAAFLTLATGYDYLKAGLARVIAEDGA